MIDELSEQEKLEQLSINKLIDIGINTQDELDILGKRYKLIKFIVRKEMIQRSANTFTHPDVECKAKYGPTTYDYGKLSKLIELFPKESFEEIGYTPEFTETKEVTTPANWDMRITRFISKYGEEQKGILEEATIKGDMIDVTFKRKKK